MPKDAERGKPADRGKTGGTPFRKELVQMEETFQALEQAANRLNQTADAANGLFRSANDRLARIGAGVAFAADGCVLNFEQQSVYNEREERDEEDGYIACVLAYAKVNGTWQLCVREKRYVREMMNGAYTGGHELFRYDDEPLLNADRELRIEAAGFLPMFLAAYTEHLTMVADKLGRDTSEAQLSPRGARVRFGPDGAYSEGPALIMSQSRKVFKVTDHGGHGNPEARLCDICAADGVEGSIIEMDMGVYRCELEYRKKGDPREAFARIALELEKLGYVVKERS